LGRTFVIAEAGSSHDNDLQKAYRLIEAAKGCGADAVKFQWTSSAAAMAQRRGLKSSDAYVMYLAYLQKPVSWLESLKAHADKVGILFMCTTYLIEDIKEVAPLVPYFKVSAFEAEWREFISAHCHFEKAIFISVNDGMKRLTFCHDTNYLYCVSKYPTKMEDLWLRRMKPNDGLSDHTGNVLSGALAVARGAPCVEAHIRLHDTDPKNPDYGHSLIATPLSEHRYDASHYQFSEYVRNIREAERAL
jgi:sialic acid synthase SpsE